MKKRKKNLPITYNFRDNGVYISRGVLLPTQKQHGDDSCSLPLKNNACISQVGDCWASKKSLTLMRYEKEVKKATELGFKINHSVYDEQLIESAALKGCQNALENYNADISDNFDGYLRLCVANVVKCAIKQEKRRQGRFPVIRLSAKIDTDDPLSEDKILYQIDTQPSVEDEIIENDEYDILHYFITLLTDREREVIYLYFGFYEPQQTQCEIAEALGLSQARVAELIKKSINKLRKYYKNVA